MAIIRVNMNSVEETPERRAKFKDFLLPGLVPHCDEKIDVEFVSPEEITGGTDIEFQVVSMTSDSDAVKALIRAAAFAHLGLRDATVSIRYAD